MEIKISLLSVEKMAPGPKVTRTGQLNKKEKSYLTNKKISAIIKPSKERK